MIILNSKKIIFLHVPKSAGSSVTEYIDRFLAWEDIVLGTTVIGELYQGYWGPRYGVSKHSLPLHIINMMGKERYKTYRKFIVVREPYSRFISAFQFISKMKEIKASWFELSTDFSYFQNIWHPEQLLESNYFADIQSKKPEECTEVELFFKNQMSFVDLDELSESRFEYFKLEDLVEDMSPLANFLGAENQEVMPHSNKTDSAEYIQDKNIRKKIREIYKSDYIFFDY
jgi:hypothetical protein